MQLNKYSKLREQTIERDFESKNKSLDKWLFRITFLGNIGSIFFAFFLVFPALIATIGVNLVSGQLTTILAGVVTVIILALFEIIKRIIVANLSLDLITTKWNLKDRGVIWWLVLTLGIIISSAYLSIDGAMNFAQITKHQNAVIENTIKVKTDSITNVYNDRKTILFTDNNKLRDANTGLRKKIDDTPLNYRTVRNELQNVVNQNLEAIQTNDNKISDLDKELNNKISQIKNEQTTIIDKNVRNNLGYIILFTFSAIIIEFIIILGLWFRKYYDYKCLKINEPKLEPIRIKKKRYAILLQFVFKEGLAEKDEKLMPVTTLKTMVREKTNLIGSDKLIDEFYKDMDHLGIFKVIGKRRYIAVTYAEALEKIEKFDNTLHLLENLI